MRTLPKWIDKIQDSDKVGQSIYDLCFNPDGTQLIVAGGNHVLVYDVADGTLIQHLKGHKEKVHTVSYAKNGEKFASGSADKTVIIWSNKLEGLLKYSHNDSVQCVAFNPLSHQLASCALTDFAFWSADQKAVQKHKSGARINSCSWTNDGQYLALALNNGTISIRNKLGEEKGKIERPNAPAIWAITWSTFKDDPTDTLCVTDWNKSLSFYTLGGKLVGKERYLGFNALKARYFPKGDYILIGGLNKACKLYTREGIMLGTVGDQQNSWVWCCEADPKGNIVAIGCDDGTIAVYQLVFNMVHGLYKERYAYRENMTDIIIQHLITEQKVRIKCRDLIKKIAIYTDRLAVQLPERVVIYELYSKDTSDMHYRAKEKIAQKLECSLLVVCSNHIVICQEKNLQSMFFSGDKEKEWNFTSPIRYIKNVGGPPSREGLLLGLKNGQVWEVHLDNVHPLLRVSVNDGIRCLDVSQRKEKLAVVDETGLCQVFKLKNGELCYQENNANSIAFNNYYEEMLAFSGNNTLSIKVMDFPAHVQKMTGFVVGLSGSKVFCLNGSAMSSLDLPLSAPMYQFIEKKMYNDAYKIACLGVTDGDWEELAHSALENMEFEIARLAFVKLQDFNYLELIQDVQDQQQKGSYPREVVLGDIYAMKGKLKEAARFYQKSGHETKALTMYTDLRMFDEAQEYLGSKDNDDLIRQKADWARNINEHKAAADMYVSIGDMDTAIEIYTEKEWTDQLVDLGRRLDKSEKASLSTIAQHLKRLNQPGAAAEIYRRLGDSAAVLQLHVEANEWAQAFALVQNQPQYNAIVYVPYAQWLAENDKFVQAQKAFHKAGKSEEAFKVFQQLTHNAVNESRFDDAGFYYWIISRQYLDLAKKPDNNKSDWYLEKFAENEKLAQIYYAYNTVHKYLEEPFTSYMPEALFNISRFLMLETHNRKPQGVSLFAIYFTLAKQARKLGANKLAKQTFDKITSFRVPQKFQEQVEIATIASRARPYNDPEELLPMCYRCSTYNPLSSTSNYCVNCGQNFIYSFVSFELLPLVEFQLVEGISDDEAIRLIETPHESKDQAFEENIGETQQTLELKIEDEDKDIDPFMFRFVDKDEDKEFQPVVLDRKHLLELDMESVLVCKWGPPLRYQFFKNLLPELHVTICNSCFKAFHVDDFELQVLQKGFCPFCRVSPDSIDVDNNSSDELIV
ncbi:intraflagellar transport protein 122 homolog [Sitophilus oryzae]|uniref:Intraflagellar transport protein 122 homolog n=1 Tax=Sitophilus oryzae TaxID=7048 RepID=A0A6J2YJJ0_SITOR|nr:intraflagellar transport protein 122 homolog [Sitophilus oryzae]XP_030763035.1 intraflagellar transport protein 122 homolog [Sitophilus oryzae]XP_030763036.1 intraflagellar transport protein 122 homolog [Sitophilus oryzae]